MFAQLHDCWTSTTIGQNSLDVNAEALAARRSLSAGVLARGAVGSCVLKADVPKLGVVRGYEENLYTRGRIRASTCWCKEKSSTVKIHKMTI